MNIEYEITEKGYFSNSEWNSMRTSIWKVTRGSTADFTCVVPSVEESVCSPVWGVACNSVGSSVESAIGVYEY